MAILGFNEFMTLLRYFLLYIQSHTWVLIKASTQLAWLSLHLNARNPLYLGAIFIVFLVGKAIWVQLDIASEFQNGFVSIETTVSSLLLFKLHKECLKSKHLIFLSLQCYTASSPPFTVHKICSHNNEHSEEISRRGAKTCSPREAKRDGTPT